MTKHLPLFIIFSAVFIFYFPVLSQYFSQDDFFQLNAVQEVNSLDKFVRLWGITNSEERNGAFFYRPLSREFYNFVIFKLFGLNPLPFHLASFIIHLSCISLVFVLFKKFFHDPLLAFLAALFYGIATPQAGTFYYHAGGIQASLATFFLLLSDWFYIKFKESKLWKYWFLTFLAFLGALVSHEIILAVLPLSLITVEFIYAKKKTSRGLKSRVIHLIPFLAVIAVFLYIDIVKIGLPSLETYTPVLSIKKIINTFVWYLAWGVGLPDMLVDYVGPGLRLNPRLMTVWGNYFLVIFPAFILAVGGIFVSLTILLIKNLKIFKNKYLLFLCLWLVAGLLPVVSLPSHKFLYYLNPTLPALFGLIFFVIVKAFHQKFFLIIFSFILLALNFVSVKVEEKTYWPIARAQIAQKLIENLRESYPVLPRGAIVYFTNDPQYPLVNDEWGNSSKQAFYALSGKDGVQLLYKDKTLKVYYEDFGGPPESEEKVYSITAGF